MTSSKHSKGSTKSKGLTILLGGLAGSGKSTTAKALAKRFKLRHVSGGDMTRIIAKEKGMNLIELGRYREANPELDRELDNKLMDEAKKGKVIVDGRTLAYLAQKRRIPGLKVFLAVDPKVSAARVAKRDGISPQKALKISSKREREIDRRLSKLWGVDTSDTSYYDVVIQTDDYSPKEVIDIISHIVRYGRS